MDGNPPPPPPVQLVRTYKRVPQLPIPTIESIRAKGASSTSNSPVALSPLSASTQISLRAPKRTCWQKIDNTARLVGDRIYCRVGKLTQKKCTDARKRRHLRATTNKRTKNTEVIEWEDIAFSVEELAALYQDEDKYMWYVAASRKGGKVIVKKHDPIPLSKWVLSAPSPRLGTNIPAAASNCRLDCGIDKQRKFYSGGGVMEWGIRVLCCDE
ncbi:hypothetical protein B0H14DRAFT_2623637 [Mycena olivaceomarginata]|nr:hypothetical protein B0H14DRAFT_2623637 [Mycena olivaceomarginata]